MDAKFLYHDIIEMLSLIKDDEQKLMTVYCLLEEQITGIGKKTNKSNNEISPEYKDSICQIADAINNGITCYLNPDTMEIEYVDKDYTYDPVEYSELNDDMVDEYGMDYMKWDSYIKFEPLEATDLIRMMEKYVSQLKDSKVGSKLVSALDDLTPVNSFMKMVKETGCNGEWEDFKRREIIYLVNDTLTNRLYQLEIKETL